MRIEHIPEKLSKILAESLSFQYSSAASMYILDGKKPSKKFGSNCYEQARSLRATLIAAGFKKTYLIEDVVVGRHRPVICVVDGERFYFDPYLMHSSLINLDTGVFPRIIDSFPIVARQKSKIEIKKIGDILTVTKYWQGQKRIDAFNFDLTRVSNEDIDFEDYFSRAFHPEQDTLSIRFLNTVTGTVDHLICPLDYDITNGNNIYIKTNENTIILQSDSPAFHRKLKELTRLISSTEEEVLEFLIGAINIYKKLSSKKPQPSHSTVPFPYQ